METMVVAFIFGFVFLAFVDVMFIWDRKVHWLNKKKKYPRWWAGHWDEKKALCWTIIWSMAISLNLVLYSVASWIFLDVSLVCFFCLASIMIYFPILYFVYLVVKYQIIWSFGN